MNKVTAGFLVVAAMLLLTAGPVCAKSNVKIGLVDVEEVFTRFSETEKVNEYLQKAKADRQKKLDQAQEELAKLKQDLESQDDALTELKKEQMRGELEEKFLMLKQDFERFEMELKNLQKKKLKELEMKIKEAIKAVGLENGFDVVMEKDAVYLGGEDITALVIDYMNR